MGLVSIYCGAFAASPTYGAVIWSGRLPGIGSAIVAERKDEDCKISADY